VIAHDTQGNYRKNKRRKEEFEENINPIDARMKKENTESYV
jgi:hypothetical protein